jgi:hypothetical protein
LSPNTEAHVAAGPARNSLAGAACYVEDSVEIGAGDDGLCIGIAYVIDNPDALLAVVQSLGSRGRAGVALTPAESGARREVAKTQSRSQARAAAKLRTLQARYEAQIRVAERVMRERDAAVVDAINAGLTRSQVAEILGVTVGRITHLAPDAGSGTGAAPSPRKPAAR